MAGPWTSATRSGPTRSAPLPQPPVSSADVAADQRELDALLDKISDAGMDGLSADEKRRLNELSKRMRGRRWQRDELGGQRLVSLTGRHRPGNFRSAGRPD